MRNLLNSCALANYDWCSLADYLTTEKGLGDKEIEAVMAEIPYKTLFNGEQSEEIDFDALKKLMQD